MVANAVDPPIMEKLLLLCQFNSITHPHHSWWSLAGLALAPQNFFQNWNFKINNFSVLNIKCVFLDLLFRQFLGNFMVIWRSLCVWLSSFFLVVGYIFTGLAWLALKNKKKTGTVIQNIFTANTCLLKHLFVMYIHEIDMKLITNELIKVKGFTTATFALFQFWTFVCFNSFIVTAKSISLIFYLSMPVIP